MTMARDLMHSAACCLDPDDSLQQAADTVLKRRLAGLPVVDASGQLLGYLSEFDLLDAVSDPTLLKQPVFRHMARQLHTVEERTPIAEVAQLFQRQGLRRLPVVRNGRLVGVIDRADLLRHLAVQRPRTVAPPTLVPGTSIDPTLLGSSCPSCF